MASPLAMFLMSIGLITVSGACSIPEDEPTPVAVRPTGKIILAPNTANAQLGSDFIDAAGRRWECRGKIVAHDPIPGAPDPGHPGEGSGIPDPSKPIFEMTVEELAEAIKPVRVVGGYEYRLTEPDTALAQRIKAGIMVSTEGHAPSAPSTGGVTPKWITPQDDRWKYGPNPGTAVGHISQNCTYMMIGPSTALSAAHCFYHSKAVPPHPPGSPGWVNGGLLTPGADNNGPTHADWFAPFGSYYADSLTIPSAWVNGAGQNPGTATSHAGCASGA